jgi:hypothetical protein
MASNVRIPHVPQVRTTDQVSAKTTANLCFKDM